MLNFSEVTNVSDDRFKQGMSIYVDSFPSNERHPVSVIEERIAGRKERMFIGEVDGKVMAIGLLFILTDSEFILLDYLAVSPEFKGKGNGAEFLKLLSQKLESEKKYFILEVEHPEYGDNKEQRKKRILFFRKNGVKTMKDVLYLLPPLDNTSVTEMCLMIMPDYGNGIMKGEMVKKLIASMYEEVYGRHADDKLLNSFINNIPSQIHLT